MNAKVKEVAAAAVENVLLAAAARSITLVGIPIMLAYVYWHANTVTDLRQRMTVVEAARAQGRAEFAQRLERLEQSDTRDRLVLEGMGRELSSVNATTAAILREIENLRREAILREQRRP